MPILRRGIKEVRQCSQRPGLSNFSSSSYARATSTKAGVQAELHTATVYAYTEIMRPLSDSKADANTKLRKSRCPIALQMVAESGHANVAQPTQPMESASALHMEA